MFFCLEYIICQRDTIRTALTSQIRNSSALTARATQVTIQRQQIVFCNQTFYHVRHGEIRCDSVCLPEQLSSRQREFCRKNCRGILTSRVMLTNQVVFLSRLFFFRIIYSIFTKAGVCVSVLEQQYQVDDIKIIRQEKLQKHRIINYIRCVHFLVGMHWKSKFCNNSRLLQHTNWDFAYITFKRILVKLHVDLHNFV